MTGVDYKDAGVDIDEGARAVDAIKKAVHATYTPEVIGDIGGFGGLFSAASFKDMDDPVLVSGTDGVGTKLELARRIGKHDTIGIDLVAMCANDIVVSGAKPLFFLDYMAVGKLNAGFAAEVVGGIAEGCKQAGCALIGGEMAEHPGVMEPDAYDLSGFCVGVVDRPKMLGPHLVKEGDIVIGLASSGLHSNGYSLVRKAYSDDISDADLKKLRLPNGVKIEDALLAPTNIYVRSILDILEADLPVRACAHITGGGITENLNRVLPAGLDAAIKLGTWEVPQIIQQVAAATKLGLYELLRTFNMGIGMVVICAPEAVAEVTESLLDSGNRAFRIGRIVSAEDVEAAGKVVYQEQRGHGE